MQVDIEPDPRLSNLRPGWLADDENWREQLQALSYEDARWFADSWRLAGGREPGVDLSWVTTKPWRF